MPDKVIAAQLTLDSKPAETSVKAFKTQLREANQELLGMSEKFGATSTQAVEAAKKVAKLKDAIGDAKGLSDAFNPDAKFRAFSNAISGVVGGFSGLTGAMALFGGKSEEVEKTLLKVQAAMALSQGINSVLEAKDSFIQLAAKIKDTAAFQKIYTTGTAIAATVTKAFGVAVDTTTIGFKVLRAAIISTGIGALVVGITLLVQAISDWVSGTDDAKKAQDNLKNSVDNLNSSLRNQQTELKRATAEGLAKAKADGKSEEEIFKLRQGFAKDNERLLNSTLQDKFNNLEEFKKLRTKDKESEQTYQDALKDYNDTYAQYHDEKSQQIVDGFNEQARIREKNESETKAAADKQSQQNKKDKQDNDKKIEDLKKANEDLRLAKIESRKKELQDIEDFGKQINAEEKAREDAEVKRLADNEILRLDNKKKIAELNALNNPDSTEFKIAKINADLELELNALAEGDLQKQILAKKAADSIVQIEKEAADAKVKIAELTEAQKLEIISIGLGQIADIIGKETAVGKVLAIGQATINTYLAATKALATYPPPWGAIAAGISIATGLSNVQKIIAVKLPGKYGGTAGALPSVSAQAPLTPQAQIATTKLDQTALNQIGNATVRAYVLDSDIEKNQTRNERLNRAARLG